MALCSSRAVAFRSLRSARPLLSFNRRCVSAQAALSIAVKGNPETKVLGDCPYCHRVLLTMEQKALEYERLYVDFAEKPKWLLDVNPSGTVPVLKDGEKHIPDSGVIVEYLEEKFPSPAVPKDAEGSEAGDGIIGAFRAYFLNTDSNQEDGLKESLHGELRKLEGRLNSIPGPFLGGATFNAADAEILPRLYHARVALGHFKKWTFPDDCPKVAQYLDTASMTDAWKKCEYSPELVIAGWGAKL